MNLQTTTNPFEVINSKLDLLASVIEKFAEANSKVSQTQNAEGFLDLNGAAAVLHMPTSSIHYHKKNSKLPFKKAGKKLMFKRDELLDWVSSFSNEGNTKTKTGLEQMKLLRKK